MSAGVTFNLNQGLYVKDPQQSKYGHRLIKHSIELLNEIGFESFNFKKLAKKIESTEASLYRYFKNKHQLLLFLESWYWEWVSYLIDINLTNLKDPKKKLKIIIKNIVLATSTAHITEYINQNLLHQVIINEGAKAYHTHLVDKENNSGLFLSYKILVEKVRNIILENNATFKYPTSLATNLFEMANNHVYFAQHLPRLTDIQYNKKTDEELIEMLEHFVFKILD